MSHFMTIVLTEKNGKTVDQLLEPYGECLEVEPYITHYKDNVEEYAVNLIDYLQNLLKSEYANISYCEKIISDIKAFKNTKEKQKLWDYFCEYECLKTFDSNGNAISTYNHNSKWDWYVIGGRYDDYFNLGNNNFSVKTLLDIVIKNNDYCLAIVTPDGKWHEKGKVGWWGTISNEKSAYSWYNEFINILIEYNREDITATIVDCHI